jgi:hypothetical protein
MDIDDQYVWKVEFPRSNSNRNEGQTSRGVERSGRFGRQNFVPWKIILDRDQDEKAAFFRLKSIL